MKKMIVITLAPFLFGAIAVEAQTATTIATETAVSTSKTLTSDKTPIKLEELPEAVRKTLQADDYKGWAFSQANLVKSEKVEYFEIELKQAEKSVLVKLDKEGKKLD